MLIGTQQKADRIPDLLKYYENTNKSFALKSTVIWALQQVKAKEALPLFLKDLSSNDPRVRDAAYKAFRSFFVDYPPRFDATASQSVRAEQISAIQEWHREQEKKASEAVKAGG
jgi:oligoendopeptidase F